MILDKIIQNDEVQPYQVEKRNALLLMTISLLLSFFVSLFITYGLAPVVALKHLEFYKSIFQNFLLLCMVPYVVAYILGRLLSLLAFIIKDDKQYATQYSVVWLLFLFFGYFVVVDALNSNKGLVALEQNCIKTQHKLSINHGGKAQEQQFCADKAMKIYPQMKRCRRVSLVDREACVAAIFKRYSSEPSPKQNTNSNGA